MARCDTEQCGRAVNVVLCSPALSLDRLRIEYDRGRSLMISPLEQAKFLRDFSARYARQRAPR